MRVAYKRDLPFTAVRLYIVAQSSDETHTWTCGVDSQPIVHGAVKRRQFFFADTNYKCYFKCAVVVSVHVHLCFKIISLIYLHLLRSTGCRMLDNAIRLGDAT